MCIKRFEYHGKKLEAALSLLEYMVKATDKTATQMKDIHLPAHKE